MKHEYFTKEEFVHSSFKQIKMPKGNIFELIEPDNSYKAKL